jgi:hypothetical protein
MWLICLISASLVLLERPSKHNTSSSRALHQQIAVFGRRRDRPREAHVDLSNLEKRVRTLEALSSRLRLVQSSAKRSERPILDTLSLIGDLECLSREVTVIKDDAIFHGEYRLALVCIREFCRLVELIARLRGELDAQGPPNILHVHLDPDTAKKIAETYLETQKRLEPHE